jgi:hypothetical protein
VSEVEIIVMNHLPFPERLTLPSFLAGFLSSAFGEVVPSTTAPSLLSSGFR